LWRAGIEQSPDLVPVSPEGALGFDWQKAYGGHGASSNIGGTLIHVTVVTRNLHSSPLKENYHGSEKDPVFDW
jgi:hypothetical protein